MEERKELNILNNLHLEQTVTQAVSGQEEGWCSAEFSAGCILEDE